ncbi:NAD(P)/FAD-dependent oxidoreductase [Pelistega europaea]|uniref:FAD-binding oxidoreductase n=1 Tax=Pelistega europaea TaxID=106147 RepID=A0A7Y4LCV7_9BURK|nr:FAD-binding oxidoreductase [Pelistega europaea]NOL49901.1 FAD-binding oxidoreductase [Pelistega europaea]
MSKANNFYPQYQEKSGWNALLPPRIPRLSAPKNDDFDVIVVGAGITGLSAARSMANINPQLNILVIEASICGEGSSGRNSGFLINLPHNTGMSGHQENITIAKKQIALYQEGMDWLKSIIDTHHIECGWNPVGKYHAAATDDGIKHLKKTLEHYQEWGIQYTEFQQGALEHKLGTSYYRFGYHSFNNIFVQPAALIRGLADTLPNNVFLWENTPVIKLEKGSKYTIITPTKTLTCQKVIIANNGFSRKLGFARDRLIGIYTYAGLTDILDDDTWDMLGEEPEWGVIPANRLGTTLRKTNLKRFMVRSAYSYENERPLSEVKLMLEQCFKNRYPYLKSHTLSLVWGGTTALTRNGALYFGKVDRDIYISVGCNGAGMIKGTIFGKLLGEMVCGLHSPQLADALGFQRPSWIPPEPIRSIAVKSAIQYQRFKAGLER